MKKIILIIKSARQVLEKYVHVHMVPIGSVPEGFRSLPSTGHPEPLLINFLRTFCSRNVGERLFDGLSYKNSWPAILHLWISMNSFVGKTT